jgi:hypothetical protein
MSAPGRRPALIAWQLNASAAAIAAITFVLWLVPRPQGPGHHHRVLGFLLISIGMAVAMAALNLAAAKMPLRILARMAERFLYCCHWPVLRFQLRFRRDWS